MELLIDEPGPPLIHEQGETEDDLGSHNPEDFQAAVSGTDWTVETIVNQMRKGRVDLNPRFQRRNAWLRQRKSQLIESMMLRYPIPQLVLAERPEAPGTYFVIDGKQRLLALRQFCVDPSDARDAEFEPLKLIGLEILEDLNGMHWNDVQANRPDLAAKFENHTIRTVFLSHWESDDLLLSLFLRLNTGSVTLSPQELRQALIPGRFVEWVDERSGSSPGLARLLGNTVPDRRMVDAELLLRFLAFNRSTIEYRGNLKRFLDDTCRWFNSTWEASESVAEAGLRDLELSIESAFNVFGDIGVCRKWTGTVYERPFNRALFDVVVGGFAHPDVREAATARPRELEDGYKRLCVTDAPFIRAVTATTKTGDAFRTRFNAWRRVVQDTIGEGFPLPVPLEGSLGVDE